MNDISWVEVIVVIGAFIGMYYGLNITYKRMKARGQGFGANSLRAIGVSFFIPTLLILGVVAQFQAETMAALLGTVAGYVLSSSDKDEK